MDQPFGRPLRMHHLMALTLRWQRWCGLLDPCLGKAQHLRQVAKRLQIETH